MFIIKSLYDLKMVDLKYRNIVFFYEIKIGMIIVVRRVILVVDRLKMGFKIMIVCIFYYYLFDVKVFFLCDEIIRRYNWWLFY